MAQDPLEDRLKALSLISPPQTPRSNTHEPDFTRPLAVGRRKHRRRTPQKTVTPTLLELPAEIRHRILQFLLSTDIEENGWTSYHHGCDINKPKVVHEARPFWTFLYLPEEFLPAQSVIVKGYSLYPNILWTCKKLLGEGTKVLVEENKYVAIRYPAACAPVITAFMMQSGIRTFWVEPGVFKSPTTEDGRPVVAIEVVSAEGHAEDHATSILVIVPLVNLASLCQALSGLKAFIIRKKGTAFGVLQVNLNICVSSIPAWKKRGFAWIVDYLKSNVIDWIGDSVDQITFSGPTTGLKLENNVRSWLQRQRSVFSIRRSPEDYEKTMHRLVRRFRKVEKQFLSNDFIASFVELNALITFSFPAFLLQTHEWTVQFVELWTWIQFYLGMSLLEDARTTEDTRLWECGERHRQLMSASTYLPVVKRFEKWCTLTPGHKAVSHFAKAEIACVDPDTRNYPSQCRKHMMRALKIMKKESATSDCDEIGEMCVASVFTIIKFQESKKEINGLILDIFGPLTPVKLIGENN